MRLGARRDVLALAVGSAQSFSSLDPYIGACLAVCRVTRALAASGAEALGLLVTLPGEKEPGANLVYEGLRHAADGLGTTVEMAIASDGAGAAPVVMALGRPSATRLVPSRFQRPGDLAVCWAAPARNYPEASTSGICVAFARAHRPGWI